MLATGIWNERRKISKIWQSSSRYDAGKPLPQIDYAGTGRDFICVDMHNELVFGSPSLRRAQANGRASVKPVILDLDAVVLGHCTGEWLHKTFFLSQLVAIVDALDHSDYLMHSRLKHRRHPDLTRYRQLFTLAASYAVGFENEAQFSMAETVVRHGHAQLIAAMDAQQIDLSTATLLTEYSPAVQLAVVGALRARWEIGQESSQRSTADLGIATQMTKLVDEVGALRQALLFVEHKANEIAATWAG